MIAGRNNEQEPLDNIVESYLAAHEGTYREALADLSAEMVRIGVWTREADDGWLSRVRRGKLTPPPEALRFMAKVAAPWVVRKAGPPYDDTAMNAVAEALTPPPRAR